MKFIILISLLTASTISFGAATCPTNSKTIATCLSTPKAGDGEIASAVESITICANSRKTLMILEKDGSFESTIAKVSERIGGTSYSVVDGDVSLSLSIPTGTRSTSNKLAKFTISYLNAKVSNSSTFTCK